MTEKRQSEILGIHHVTAMAGAPQVNVDFYTRVLGLRMVKKTVNFDDPGTYHLYYGDELGHPGTILTFFPWPGAARGQRGAGQATATAFRVPEDTLDYWRERFERLQVAQDGVAQRFNRQVLTFRDHDGLLLELVADVAGAGFQPWRESPVPAERAIRGFYGVTLTEAYADLTSRFLSEIMGFELIGEDGDRRQFRAGTGDGAAAVEVVGVPGAARGRISAGTVHHIAWRVAGDDEQQEWRERLVRSGTRVTAIVDRNYFRSIYFREPGGVLFEIATDPPGFTVDESAEALGRELTLPPWLEPQRARIEAALPPLQHAAEAAGD